MRAPDDVMSDVAEAEQGPIVMGLFRSVGNLAATLVGIAHTRLQLLTTELQEEVQRAAQVLLWAAVALLAGMLALFLGALTIIFYFWDTHRLLASLLVTGGLFAVAAIAVAVLMAKLRAKPQLLDATLGELKRDHAHLRGEA
jgi:uncharacterized membrane protein YqjE